MYDLLAFHSKPVYGWQYVSGSLMHGSKGAPIWFLWVHLLLNGLMILPFGGLLERKRGSRQVLIVLWWRQSSLPSFSLLNTRAGHSGNRDLCRRLCLCDRRGYAPAKRVEGIITHRKMALSILNFSIWAHALTSNHRMDLNAIASFRDCELSIGLYWK